MSIPMLPVDHTDFVMNYNLLPEAYRQDYQNVIQLSSAEQYEEAERICRNVLARYDDRDSGMFREELASILEGKEDYSGSRKILRELVKEPVCADRAHLALARMNYHEERISACLEELDKIRHPEKDVYAEMTYIRAACVLSRDGVKEAREILLEGIRTIADSSYEAALKDFLIVRLFSFLLTWDMDEDMPEFLVEDVNGFCEYLEQIPGTPGMDIYLLTQLSPMISTMLESTMYRSFFEDIIDAMEKSGRLQDEPGTADGLRGAMESFEAGEDESANPVVLRYVSAEVLEEPDPYELTKARWLAAKLYKESPREFDRFRFMYPYFFKEAEEGFSDIEKDADAVMRQCAEEYAEQNEISADRAAARLNRMYEVETEYDNQVAALTEEVRKQYPEDVLDMVMQARYLFHREEYEMIHHLVNSILEELGHPDEYLQYMQIAANARLGDERSAQKQLKKMKRDFPDRMRTALAEGIVLSEKKKFRQAEKVLSPLIPTDEDPYELMSVYKDALEMLGRSGQVRSVFLQQMKETEAENPEPGLKRSFQVCAWLMLAETDVMRKNGDNLNSDLQNLKDYLEKHPLDSLEEFRLSYRTTRFCSAVQEAGFGIQEFADYVRWCDERDVFAPDNPIIPSAYSAFESFLAYEDDNLDDHLYDYVSVGRDFSGDSEPQAFAEAFWRAAETIRQDPDSALYMKEHYPHFIGPMMSDIDEIIEDPEEAKHLAEEMLAAMEDKQPEEIRAALNFSMGILGDDADSRRFS